MNRRQLLGGSLFGACAALCSAEPAFSVHLTRTRTRLALIPLLVGDTRLSFVVDTGATNSIIATEALEKVGPGEFRDRGPMSVLFTGGRAPAHSITLGSVAVVGGERVRLDVAGMSLAPFREQFGEAVDGLLGMDLLARYGLRFDFRGQRLDLLPPETEVTRPDAVKFDLDAERKILFPAQISGRMVTALLDTGAVQSGVNWAAAEQAGVSRSTPGLAKRDTIVGGDGQPWTVHEFPFRVRAGSVSWNRRPLIIADVPAFESMGLRDKPAAILGIDLMDGHAVEISLAGRLLAIA